MAKHGSAKREKDSLRQWFFFGIVIPILFAGTLALLVFSLLGVNVIEKAGEYANQVPGLNKMVSTSDQNEQSIEKTQLQTTIAESKSKIEELQSEVESKQSVIEDLEQQVARLEAEVQSSDEDEKKSDTKEELAASFEVMDPEEAAPIFEKMNRSLAVQVLAKVPSEERGNILGKMDPELAAGIANALVEE